MSQNFVSSIQYCILDEIHSISEYNGGSVWERVLVMLPCPIIALSATIGNYEGFAQWLKEVMAVKNQEIALIQHSGRWNDINMFRYQSTGGERTPKSPQWQLGYRL